MPKFYTRDYTEKDVLWRLRDQLQLRAVLAPLTGRYHSKAEIPLRARKIQKWWRAKAGDLRHKGWCRLADPKKFRSARTCPMTFLMVYGKPRPCTLRTACPFCWARQAAEWWDVVDAAFFRDATDESEAPNHGHRAGRAIELDVDDGARRPQPRKVRAAGYRLVVRVRTLEFRPYCDTPDGRVDLLRDFYRARLGGPSVKFRPGADFVRGREVAAHLKAVRLPGRRAGCFENITAEVTPDRERWRVSIRQVWLVPDGADLPVITPVEGVAYTESVREAPWRTQVMKAMAQACRYPRAMLARWKDGAPAFQLVEARKGLRLAATFGDFRRKGGTA